jgi:hypothetical protein
MRLISLLLVSLSKSTSLKLHKSVWTFMGTIIIYYKIKNQISILFVSKHSRGPANSMRKPYGTCMKNLFPVTFCDYSWSLGKRKVTLSPPPLQPNYQWVARGKDETVCISEVKYMPWPLPRSTWKYLTGKLHLSLAVLNEGDQETFSYILLGMSSWLIYIFFYSEGFRDEKEGAHLTKWKSKDFGFIKTNFVFSSSVWSTSLQLVVLFSFVKEQIDVLQMVYGYTLFLTGSNYNHVFLIWSLRAVTKHYKNDLSSCFTSSDPASLWLLLYLFLWWVIIVFRIFQVVKHLAELRDVWGDYI